jgi:hypothetical protein
MPREVMRFTNPILRVADTEAGLATGTAFECQITSAVITPAPVFSTVPATGCAPASQSPGATAFTAELAWLQDWSVADGLSDYAWTRAGDAVWLELVPTGTDPAVKVHGEVYVVEGALGGTFGDGSAGVSTASWPFLAKPTMTPGAAALAATARPTPAPDESEFEPE